MWIATVPLSELDAAGRWTVSFFSTATASQLTVYPMAPLRELVDERKSSVDPQSLDGSKINYLGLENIRSKTGELVDFAARPSADIKSRSKMYETGDVLFGRLRPELNKVYLAEPQVSPGICSNEFVVLRARPSRVTPRYLRYILASPYVSQFAQKLRSGASLPRMSSADLLELSVPVPPLGVQAALTESLEQLDRILRELRRREELLPGAITDALMASLQSGSNELPKVEAGLAQFAQ